MTCLPMNLHICTCGILYTLTCAMLVLYRFFCLSLSLLLIRVCMVHHLFSEEGGTFLHKKD